MQETTVDLLGGIWEIVADTVKSKLNTLFVLAKNKNKIKYPKMIVCILLTLFL